MLRFCFFLSFSRYVFLSCSPFILRASLLCSSFTSFPGRISLVFVFSFLSSSSFSLSVLVFFIFSCDFFFRAYIYYRGYVPGGVWLQVIWDGTPQLVSTVSLFLRADMVLPCALFRMIPRLFYPIEMRFGYYSLFCDHRQARSQVSGLL